MKLQDPDYLRSLAYAKGVLSVSLSLIDDHLKRNDVKAAREVISSAYRLLSDTDRHARQLSGEPTGSGEAARYSPPDVERTA